MSPKGNLSPAPSHDEEASELFIRRLYGEWSEVDQAAFETRLAADAGFAQAQRRVENSWHALDRHSEAPELVTWRAEAIDLLRRSNARRWYQPRSKSPRRMKVFALAAAIVLALCVAWQLSPHGYRPGEYRTTIGEQRSVELEDHSRITLDAASRLKVHFTDETRSVQLLEGQAQFSVAKDSARPFKVIVGDRTIVALGTVFTVEYVDRKIHVAMLEGKVAVLAPNNPSAGDSRRTEVTGTNTLLPEMGEGAESNSSRQGSDTNRGEIYLTAGEELRVAHNGRTVFTPKADLEAATAWREGKIIFRTEPLGEAVSRMNRYSRLQLEIQDATLASKHISGVFEAGDTRGFVNALQRYLPIDTDESDSDTIRLKSR